MISRASGILLYDKIISYSDILLVIFDKITYSWLWEKISYDK